MANDNAEANDYDLSSTGTIVELPMSGGAHVGWRIEATGNADYVVEIRGNSTDWLEIDSYSATASIDDGKTAPEALRIRIRNTSTASETADVLLGVDN
jgi:ABC-type phosphonate transport system ATPase subunit